MKHYAGRLKGTRGKNTKYEYFKGPILEHHYQKYSGMVGPFENKDDAFKFISKHSKG